MRIAVDLGWPKHKVRMTIEDRGQPLSAKEFNSVNSLAWKRPPKIRAHCLEPTRFANKNYDEASHSSILVLGRPIAVGWGHVKIPWLLDDFCCKFRKRF